MSQRMPYSQRGGRGGQFGGGSRPRAKTVKPSPNPIFEEWLMEWRDDAAAKGSKMQYVYSKALASMKKYPLPLSSGRECIVLEYIGPALCKQIDERLSQNPDLQRELMLNTSAANSRLSGVVDIDSPSPKMPSKRKNKKAGKARGSDRDDIDLSSDGQPSPKKKASQKRYVPAYRSGGYGILVALFKKEETPNYRGYMLKSELQREAQDFCDASFTKPENPGGAKRYTAWACMSTLVSKELVLRQGNPIKFTLTIDGRELAAKLLSANASNDLPTNKFPPASAASGGYNSQSCDSEDEDEAESVLPASFPRVTLEPNTFEVMLCVDTGEASSKSRKEEVIGELRKNGVPLEVMRLNIGDFVWVCRKTVSLASASHRLTISKSHDMVLPYVVERKRTDDLAHSIKDGRFHEQKHRLEQTGLQPIYLIESYGSGDWGLADGAITQAIANTQITNNFLIQETGSLKDTCAFLTHMTRRLTGIYQGKRVSNCSKEEWLTLKASTTETYLMAFNDFNEFATKARNWTVSEMFARHLMKLRGLSVERAYAIIQRYPTPTALFRAYRDCSSLKDRESLLATLNYGNHGKTIGISISRTICKLYTETNLQ